MIGPIGVIGGMGPEATVLFQQRLIKAVPARDDGDHIPLLIDMNPQIPSRLSRLLDGVGDDPAPVLAAMAQRLETMGAVALAMPCNTAHHYADAICAAVSIPLLHMPALAAAKAATLTPAGGKVGVLASPATDKIGLFRDVLAAHDLTPVYPADAARMLHAIRRLKSGQHDASDAAILNAAAAKVAAAGATCLLVGCSEFSMIREAADGHVPVIDTLDVLVDAVVAHAKPATADSPRSVFTRPAAVQPLGTRL